MQPGNSDDMPKCISNVVHHTFHICNLSDDSLPASPIDQDENIRDFQGAPLEHVSPDADAPGVRVDELHLVPLSARLDGLNSFLPISRRDSSSMEIHKHNRTLRGIYT